MYITLPQPALDKGDRCSCPGSWSVVGSYDWSHCITSSFHPLHSYYQWPKWENLQSSLDVQKAFSFRGEVPEPPLGPLSPVPPLGFAPRPHYEFARCASHGIQGCTSACSIECYNQNQWLNYLWWNSTSPPSSPLPSTIHSEPLGSKWGNKKFRQKINRPISMEKTNNKQTNRQFW